MPGASTSAIGPASSLCLEKLVIPELIQVAPERHVVTDNEVLAADPEELAELHACNAPLPLETVSETPLQ